MDTIQAAEIYVERETRYHQNPHNYAYKSDKMFVKLDEECEKTPHE